MCEPTPWGVPDDGPAMTPIPNQFQHESGSTLLQWRVYTPADGTAGIEAVQSYVNSCVPSEERAVSPTSLVNTNTKNSFRSLFLVNSIGDQTVPGRQIFDMQCVLNNAGVNPSNYTVLQIADPPYDKAHALNLWPAPDPNTGRTVGGDVIAFFHQYLD
jgi:hypothetical protein